MVPLCVTLANTQDMPLGTREIIEPIVIRNLGLFEDSDARPQQHATANADLPAVMGLPPNAIGANRGPPSLQTTK